jgi:hypothetical protein
MRLAELDMTDSFAAALTSYAESPSLSLAHRAHVKRWSDDDRAEEVWNVIDRAAQECGRVLPVRFFIQETLGARDVAQSLHHQRKNRERYRKHAAQMMEIANVLRKPLPRWLDHEVAVLAQIAFDDPDIDREQVFWVRRRVERSMTGNSAG